MEDLEFQIVDGGLWSEDRQSRFEASIMYFCLSFVANHAILRTS